MSVESSADRAALLADFGMNISWQVGAGAPAEFTALYDSGTIEQEFQDGAGGLNTRATLTLRAEDLPAGAGAAADVIVVNTVTFHPKAMKPDGTGLVIVTLEQDLS